MIDFVCQLFAALTVVGGGDDAKDSKMSTFDRWALQSPERRFWLDRLCRDRELGRRRFTVMAEVGGGGC